MAMKTVVTMTPAIRPLVVRSKSAPIAMNGEAIGTQKVTYLKSVFGQLLGDSQSGAMLRFIWTNPKQIAIQKTAIKNPRRLT